ncbi:TonB-dependent receptor plug domain-containing protein [Novimethylophilus kurashikiensis]|uniref:TonB-dependent receptor plug domain-containing protein n=1 Tax=Novimethylophilus kurashikiensis TaxID=1825523 RepID=UPI001D1324F1|nr:Plug domain-containing protein [Novimethylophilus kurashikiensis]
MLNQLHQENRLSFLVAAISILQPFAVLAQDAEATETVNEKAGISQEEGPTVARSPISPVNLDTVVVTATANPLTSMRSSVAASILTQDQIEQSVPGNAAEILNNVPGLLVQSSGGEGNANATARGLPLSGGAKLMQYQEDGLPVLDFGDIDFGTADTFVRADYNLDRLEVIRGGSAATFASNAPRRRIQLHQQDGGGSRGKSPADSGPGLRPYPDGFRLRQAARRRLAVPCRRILPVW